MYPGCHLLDARSHVESSWALSVEEFCEDNYDATDFPDLSIDPEDGVLSIINSSTIAKAYHVSLSGGVEARGRNELLLKGLNGVTTLVLALGPRTQVDACFLDGPFSPECLDSDVVDIVDPPSDASLKAPSVYRFPLVGPGPFLCTQGAGGLLSHFVHSSVYRAVDFGCPVGTLVVAIAPGTVRTIETSHSESTIHVRGLFNWNRIVLDLDDGSVAEYVHVAHRSHRVRQGERVQEGQPICASGDVGFCPEPHLHIELHLDSKPSSPSVRLFRLVTRNYVSPCAGFLRIETNRGRHFCYSTSWGVVASSASRS